MTTLSKHPNYQKFKDAATQYNRVLNDYRKKHGYSIKEVLAMSPGNDPFWMTVGKVFKAHWATEIMENIVKPHLVRNNLMDKGIHLRDIHYMLIGRNLKTWDDSEVYQNTDAHWGLLLTSFANARYLDLIDPKLIRDKKNEFHERTNYRTDWAFSRRIIRGKEDLTKENVLDIFVSWFDNLKKWHNHASVHIEIWAEKDLALLDQVAEEYDINTVIGEGETSITQVYQIVERMKKAGKPVRIGYVSDFDVVGTNMSKAMARKVEFVISQLEEEGIDVKITHLMLDTAQVMKHGLPTAPMKTKADAKTKAYETRKDNWKKAHGVEGAVEINSFHALYPDEFKDVLVRFITSYYDKEIEDKIEEFNENQADIIRELVSNDDNINMLMDEFLKGLLETIGALDWAELEEAYDNAFEDLLEEHGELDYAERDEHYQWMLDSELDYSEQLSRYNDYEAGKLDNPEEN